MKEVEITVTVNEKLNSAINKITNLGFEKIRESYIKDTYLTQFENELNKGIEEVMNKSVLLRFLNANGEEFKKITYKHKDYKDGKLISETKINLNCEDLDKAYQLFTALGFKELITVKYVCPVYEKNGFELAFQEVEGLGLLLEVESILNLDNATNLEILNEKKNMYQKLLNLGLIIGSDLDVKKAKELIKSKYSI